MGSRVRTVFMLSASTLALIIAMGSSQSAFAAARCMTNITVDKANAVTDVGQSVAVTGTADLNTLTGNAVTDTYFHVDPKHGPDFHTTDLGKAFEAEDHNGDADLESTTGKFLNKLPGAVNVVKFGTATKDLFVQKVTPQYGEGPNGTFNPSSASGADAFACGPGASAEGDNASAFGEDSHARGDNASAVGQDAHAHGDDATAMGQNSRADGENATALGQGSRADGQNATAVGENSSVYGENATALGQNARAFGHDATAVGQDALADGSNATAVGEDSRAIGRNATSVGQDSHADGRNATALVQDAHAHGRDATAIGQDSRAEGTYATAVGEDSLAIGGRATALGQGAYADGSTALAVGQDASAYGRNATAIGQNAYADGRGATAIGQDAYADGRNSTALGQDSYADGRNATALGADSYAARNGTAIGRGTQANAEGSVAIGRDSGGGAAVASLENQFVLGTSNHTYTAPGITSDLSRSRQSGPLEVATSDANGNLATDGGQIFRELGEQGAGIAIALALENPDLVGNERFGMSANLGFFEGNTALGVALMGVLGHNFVGEGERWALSGGVGLSLNENNFGGQDTDRTVAGRAGVQVSW